ncbi:MAG: protein-tyrosine-phosphatase [Flavobacteriia bacterium]
MYDKIKTHCDNLITQFDSISADRKALLEKIANYIQVKKEQQLPVNLIYVCTHNSRRSHFGQVWSAVAAAYYGIQDVHTFSGGTEATAFNPNAIQALKETGFEIEAETQSQNPKYSVKFGDKESTTCFSKVYNAPMNPNNHFAAIMTCSDAEENCPFIPGVELRIGTTYDDPKAFDGTPLQAEKYLERSNQIAIETLYVFSLIK